MFTAVVGINWGDEGKGRMVDLLSSDYDIICRYQGGNNAGHTVVNERGKFILNLFPSGIFRKGAVNVMGNGMVIDLEHLSNELSCLRKRGIVITPENLKISEQATICLPYHKLQDILEEDRLGLKKFGSTRRGIAPVYADKYMKKSLRLFDLYDFASLEEKVKDLLEWKNMLLNGYENPSIMVSEIMTWLEKYGKPLLPFSTNTTTFLTQAATEEKNVLFEAQLGTLRDIDFGIYPYTSSSSTLAAYAPIGSGIPFQKLDKTIGIMKAYSSCVGEGPFTAELFGEEGDFLRAAGNEYGSATGRPRRVGAFDIPASAYGVKMQGADEVALTKLDVLSYCEKIPVCVAYEIDGEVTTDFPTGERLLRAKPVYEYLEGFQTDISHCKTMEELPSAAITYIRFLEKSIGCPITYVSVGPSRNDYLVLPL